MRLFSKPIVAEAMKILHPRRIMDFEPEPGLMDGFTGLRMAHNAPSRHPRDSARNMWTDMTGSTTSSLFSIADNMFTTASFRSGFPIVWSPEDRLPNLRGPTPDVPS